MVEGTIKNSVKGGVIIDGNTLEVRIPKEVIEIFKGEPRVIFKKLEWYGIHPLSIEMLSNELKALGKDYTIIAVPKEMLR